ncbi:amidohydrolase family protein [Halomicrobium salinisoli]|uniref:amidohydrolase family protein n=1 Tax=Halomicrobium salinisoli TaxID=2878391 RepID=UPI001CEFE932|nr:amidohydrolase family protein [Halomicrobium salinisoli]
MTQQNAHSQSFDAVSTVVDTDVHVSEMQYDIVPYLEEPFGEVLTQDREDGYINMFYPNAGHLRPSELSHADPGVVRSVEDLSDAMAMLDTDVSLLTPGLNLALGAAHHDELAAGLATAYNNWLLDTLLDDAGDQARGALVVAPQCPQRAAEEIERRKDESDFKAVMIPSGGVNPMLGHERYFPIYEAAEDAGLPVLLHAAASVASASFPMQWHGAKRHIDTHVTSHPAEQMWHLSTLLTNGVPVRYPDLDIVIQEAGIGWIPYFIRRYDNEYSKGSEDAPLLEKRPSSYIDDSFYFTSQPVEGADDPQYVTQMVRLFNGSRNLMFSSDFPHYDFDHSGDFYRSLQTEFSDDEIANIYGETAIEVFDL